MPPELLRVSDVVFVKVVVGPVTDDDMLPKVSVTVFVTVPPGLDALLLLDVEPEKLAETLPLKLNALFSFLTITSIFEASSPSSS